MADKLNYSTYQTQFVKTPSRKYQAGGLFSDISHQIHERKDIEGSEKEKILINLVMKHSFEH